jgi:hypothetical protein
MSEPNGDPAVTAKLVVDEHGDKGYVHAICAAMDFAKAGNFKSASFWRRVADQIGTKSYETAADVVRHASSGP